MKSGGVLRMDTATATGFVIETGLYSAYTYLFIAALPGMTSARRLKDAHRARSAWVFLIFSILMYAVATVHLIFAAFRFYKSLFLNVDGAISYLNNSYHWEYFPLIVLFCVQTWLGDVLVIYRCYFVWNSNPLLIFVPVCLLLASIGLNLVMWYWSYHPFNHSHNQVFRVFKWIFPLSFAQNLMTTGLIILKIFLQHRASKKAGIVHIGSTLSLIQVVRVVIESAAIYTIQLLALIILFFRGDNVQFIIQSAINPSIGITFVLLAIRVEPSKTTSSATKSDLGIISTLIPRWLHNTESDIDTENSEAYGAHSLSKAGDSTEVMSMDTHRMDALNNDGGRDDRDTELSHPTNQSSRPVLTV